MKTSKASSRYLRRAISWGAVVMVAIGLALLFLLAQATSNQALYERNYAWLFSINVAVASALLTAVFWVSYRLILRLREGRFGSRLLVKLATIFALVGLAPGMLIYIVSYQFVSRSIENWFDVRVEGALEAGLNLGRVSLDALSSDLAGKARVAAHRLSDNPDPQTGLLLDRMLDQMSVTDAVIWTSGGVVIASAGDAKLQLRPEMPTPSQFRSAKIDLPLSWVEGLEEATPTSIATVRAKVLVPIPSNVLRLRPEQRFLLVSRALPENLVLNALAVDAAYREYQERSLSRQGLKRMYIGTLTLSLFLAVFGAVLLAVALGNQIVLPLLTLAEGVSQVASGDLTPKLALQGKDELVSLTRAFAVMTEQLSEARQTVQHSMERVETARQNLQTILDNLTAGVMVLGPSGEVRSFNPGAARILRAPLNESLGKPLATVDGLKDFALEVEAQFAVFTTNPREAEVDHWQQSFHLGRRDALAMKSPFDQEITLVARGAELPDDARLLVFDDISEIVSAQRSQAWGEVARRLAHEIKNPLTPIQLSAERLERRLTGKLEDGDQLVLTKSVKTIVDQVDALKRLVNEFRDYARLPAADLKAVSLNALVLDVMQLYEENSGTSAIQIDLDPVCPRVLGDAQQLRQVIHNLIQNAQDANEMEAAHATDYEPRVTVRTQFQAATKRVRLTVSDNGGGFAEHILKRAFEPYVTTKVKGTGLGLAVVKKIADEHGSRVDITNRLENGTIVGAQVSLSLAPEDNA
jgi:nitrogen fixation/metabolism regulation signal transduction histidine kinase